MKKTLPCSFCGREIQDRDTHFFIPQEKNGARYHATCLFCGHSSVVFERRGVFGSAFISKPTDVTVEEVRQALPKAEKISTDDVLGAYRMLKNFRGGVRALFQEKNR